MTGFLRSATMGAVVSALFVGASLTMAAEKEHSGSNNVPQPAAREHVQHEPFLGVGVAPLSPAFASHLPKMFSNGQGVLVTAVAKGSPAAKANIKPYDVLMTYNDQKLFSPEQLVKLVRSDKVGQHVTLGIVHQGKLDHIKVTLGQREAEYAGLPEQGLPEWWPWSWPTPQWFSPSSMAAPSQNNANQNKYWESFESMTIRNLGDHRFKAEIRYLGKDGKLVSRQFEGTRDQIDKAVLAQKDLPQVERTQLLRSLNMPTRQVIFPHVYAAPGQPLSWNFG
jgi:hypothetical protein